MKERGPIEIRKVANGYMIEAVVPGNSGYARSDAETRVFETLDSLLAFIRAWAQPPVILPKEEG